MSTYPFHDQESQIARLQDQVRNAYAQGKAVTKGELEREYKAREGRVWALGIMSGAVGTFVLIWVALGWLS